NASETGDLIRYALQFTWHSLKFPLCLGRLLVVDERHPFVLRSYDKGSVAPSPARVLKGHRGVARNQFSERANQSLNPQGERLTSVGTPVYVTAQGYVLPISRVPGLALALSQEVDHVASEIERFVLQIVAGACFQVLVRRKASSESIALASSYIAQE